MASSVVSLFFFIFLFSFFISSPLTCRGSGLDRGCLSAGEVLSLFSLLSGVSFFPTSQRIYYYLFLSFLLFSFFLFFFTLSTGMGGKQVYWEYWRLADWQEFMDVCINMSCIWLLIHRKRATLFF